MSHRVGPGTQSRAPVSVQSLKHGQLKGRGGVTLNHQKDSATLRSTEGKGPGGRFGFWSQRMQALRSCQKRTIKAKDLFSDFQKEQSLGEVLVKGWGLGQTTFLCHWGMGWSMIWRSSAHYLEDLRSCGLLHPFKVTVY